MAQPIDMPDLPPRFAALADFREGARRRLPHFVFEYLDGGIGRDVGLARNYEALDRVRLTPRTVDEGVKPKTEVEVLGHKSAYPFCVAPVGMTGLFHPRAAKALEKKSAELGVPYCLSFVGSETAETIKRVAGRPPWHQYYWPRPVEAQDEILKRMKEIGVEVLMPTLDIPGHQWRER
ncbi:MAG: alpha-hydroxy-acid oxidizing protein, partial [Pseudomonadota bacterium]